MIYKCPVCDGRGTVSCVFYTNQGFPQTTGSTTPEQCKSCNGQGVIDDYRGVGNPGNIKPITK